MSRADIRNYRVKARLDHRAQISALPTFQPFKVIAPYLPAWLIGIGGV